MCGYSKACGDDKKTDQKERVFSDLYDIVQGNMPEHELLSFSRKVFLVGQGEKMDRCNLLRLYGLGRRDFFMGTYVLALRRIPENEEMIKNTIEIDMPESEWRSSIIKRIVGSNEYVMKKTYCENNIFDASVYDSQWVRIKQGTVEILYKIYKKSPVWMKNLERKMASMIGLVDE